MKKRRDKQILAILTACGVLSNCYTVLASEPVEFDLEPIIVSATRTEKKDLDIPSYTKIITSEDIEKKGNVDLTDILDNEISINTTAHMRDYGDITPANSRFHIRGLDKGTLVLVNGAPVGFSNFNAALIPASAIEKIEVIKGSNSVLYGSEAMGGVVNIITKKGKRARNEIAVTGGDHRKWSVSSEGTKYFINFTRDYIPEYEHARLNKSGYTNFAKHTKNNLVTSLNLTDKLSANYLHSEVIRGGYGLFNNKGVRTNPGYEFDNQFDNFSLAYNDQEANLNSTLTYSRKRLDWRKIEKSGKYVNGSNTSNYIMDSWNFDVNKKINLSESDKLLVGGTFYREGYEQLRNKKNKTHRNSVGLFTSYDHKLSDKWGIIFGLRGQFEGSDGFTGSKRVFLPQLQTLYKMNDRTSWYTNIGKSFEMPPLNAQFARKKVHEYMGIKPQEGWTYEMGLKHITDKESYKMALFYMDFKNKFAWDSYENLGITPPPGVPKDTFIQINRGYFKNLGIDFDYNRRIDKNWTATLGITLQNPRSKDKDDWFQESARIQGRIGVGYSHKKINVGINMIYNADRESGTSYDKLPTSVSVNANAGYKINNNQNI